MRFCVVVASLIAAFLAENVEETVAFVPLQRHEAISSRRVVAQRTTPTRPLPSPLIQQLQQHQQLIRGNSRRTSTTGVAPLQALPLAIAASPLGSIGILAFIVLVHEGGHYLAAKSFGIEIEEFSIGFGPKLLGFTYGGDEFNLRALPLGGYVKFPENYNVTQARLAEEADIEAAEEFMRNRQSGLGSKLVNIVTLGALDDKIWTDEKKRRATETEQEQTTKLPSWWQRLGKKKSTTSKSSAKAVVSTEIEYYDNPSLLQNRPWQQRAVVLSGGVIFNLLLAFVIYFGQINFGPGLPVPTFDNGVVVTAAPRADAAARGLLNKGDVIVGINGMPVTASKTTNNKPSAMESQKALTEFIAKIRATPDGESLKLSVLHPNNNKKEDVITVQPKRNNANGPQSIGVLLSPNFVKTDVLQTNNPIEAADLSLKYVTSLTKETANGLLSFFAGLVTGGAASSGGGAQVSGPIGLIRTGSEVVATKDWTAILLFAAAISINLGVINSIPLPALDGGQLVFVLAEAVTGRKVDQRFQEGITGVAVLFLLLLSAQTFVGDLSSLFAGR